MNKIEIRYLWVRHLHAYIELSTADYERYLLSLTVVAREEHERFDSVFLRPRYDSSLEGEE